MIPASELRGAMHALQFLTVRARAMVYDRQDHEAIAEFLDRVETLPFYVGATADMSEEFRRDLREIAERFPICASALCAFEHPPEQW